MVRTRKSMGVAALLDDLDPAMLAQVREGTDVALLVAGHDDRLVDDFPREIVARVRNLFLASDADPVAHEQALLFQAEYLRRRVIVRRQMRRPFQREPHGAGIYVQP